MEVSKKAVQTIESFLFERTGQQLTENRHWRLQTVLPGICEQYGIENIEHLADRVGQSKDHSLLQDVTDALVNNETYFFRDRPTFSQLSNEILPLLASRKNQNQRLKIWSAGCSTGQEAYSLAMDIADQEAKWRDWSISILGTDVSKKAITAAKRATFSQFDVQRGLGITQLLKHFVEGADGWRLSADICKATRFQTHNVIDPPPSREKFDLILCRNVLLYFSPETRARAFERLHTALAPDGYLMLGAGETVIGRTSMFKASKNRPSIFEPVH